MKKFLLFVSFAMYSMAAAEPLAGGGAKFLGNITTSGQIRSDMGDLWNQITPENG